MKKRIALFTVLAMAMASLCSCYYKTEIESNEVGLIMDDGVSVTNVVGAGRYTDFSRYADIVSIDVSTKKIVMTIEDVSTSDKQTVGLEVLAEVSRMSDEASVRNLWKNYNAVAKKDERLTELVQDLLRSPVNKVSTQMTVDEMLGVADSDKTRATMENDIFNLLSPLLSSRGIALTAFQVMNISVDPQYQAKLQEKSTAAIEIELAEQKAKQLEKQLEQEKAQTEIDLEKARRANLVAEEQAKVYEESKEAYELKRLEMLKGMLGESDKVYFIPEGTDITLFLGNEAPMGMQ
jgi:hypothetical protein